MKKELILAKDYEKVIKRVRKDTNYLRSISDKEPKEKASLKKEESNLLLPIGNVK